MTDDHSVLAIIPRVSYYEPPIIPRELFLALPWSKEGRREKYRMIAVMFATALGYKLRDLGASYPLNLILLPIPRDENGEPDRAAFRALGPEHFSVKLHLDICKIAAGAWMLFDPRTNALTIVGEIGLHVPPIIDDFEWQPGYLPVFETDREIQRRAEIQDWIKDSTPSNTDPNKE